MGCSAIGLWPARTCCQNNCDQGDEKQDANGRDPYRRVELPGLVARVVGPAPSFFLGEIQLLIPHTALREHGMTVCCRILKAGRLAGLGMPPCQGLSRHPKASTGSDRCLAPESDCVARFPQSISRGARCGVRRRSAPESRRKEPAIIADTHRSPAALPRSTFTAHEGIIQFGSRHLLWR